MFFNVFIVMFFFFVRMQIREIFLIKKIIFEITNSTNYVLATIVYIVLTEKKRKYINRTKREEKPHS